jgi:hypothetical protein
MTPADDEVAPLLPNTELRFFNGSPYFSLKIHRHYQKQQSFVKSEEKKTCSFINANASCFTQRLRRTKQVTDDSGCHSTIVV